MEETTMLVLSRKVGETIQIEGQIKVKILRIDSNRVRVGVEAPDDVRIVRGELGEWLDLPLDGHSSFDSTDRSTLAASTIE
jgi:carbon storage regulator